MKFLLIVFCMVIFLFTGCDSLQDVPINVSAIYIQNKFSDSQDLQLSTEQSELILTIINNAEWEIGVTKTACSYIFRMPNGDEFFYSPEAGLFSDRANIRTLVLAEGEKEMINNLIN